MNEEDRRRFESLFSAYDLAWRQFNERRDTEFKMSLTIWTALALATAGSFSIHELPAVPNIQWIILAAGVILVGLHALWCWGLGRAQRADRAVALCYEQALKSLARMEFDDYTRGILERTPGRFKGWSYFFQLGVTIVLTGSLVLSNWEKSLSRSAEDVRQLEVRKLDLEVQELDAKLRELRDSAARRKDLQRTAVPSKQRKP